MSNYPKMLYKGNQENYQTVIADDEDHESELIEQGWCEYGKLPKSTPDMKYASGVLDRSQEKSTDSFINQERFELATQELAETKQELVTANEEIERLNQIIATGSAENAELRKKLRIKELEDTSADDLKALLTERNVQFGARDSKAVLLNLVIETE